mmetsp:Transcript_10106/g.43013  ORF Transcript_10106/g.43013 Transcript_10106/m.43013 type:complete len:333 (-) Transcript_10106:1150-2148(-)
MCLARRLSSRRARSRLRLGLDLPLDGRLHPRGSVGLHDVLDDGLLDPQHLRERRLDLHVAHRVVRARRLDHLRLLLLGEVLPREPRVAVVAVQFEDLVVRDGARVGPVVRASEFAQSTFDGHGHELLENGHGVGDVHDFRVVGDLRDEVARVLQVAVDGHAHAALHDVRVVAQHHLHVGLGFAVERAAEVGVVLLRERLAPDLVLVVVLVDAPGGEVGDVHVVEERDVAQVQDPDDVRADGLRLVVLAPVHVGAAGDARGAQDVRALRALDVIDDRLAVLQARAAERPLVALFRKQLPELAADPAGAPVHEEHGSPLALVLGGGLVRGHHVL